MPAFTLNGHPVDLRMDAQTPLLWGLRCGANLTGAKYGCGTGECGACMVMVDGQALPSCQMTLAQAQGRAITTIEGLSRDRSHPLQQALVAEGAIQCGFCTPGIVMAGAALLAANADPSTEDIGKAVTNLCRCGIYPRLVRAIQRAGRVMRGLETIAAAPAPGGSARQGPGSAPQARGDNDQRSIP
ncbi:MULTISPECIES: (2Fe-2S)-binding protein [unclassified Novosphingobium]|uniref:(2Fe-2S)-binding protein n=1 Tax=unclassified Novosphingobium TaxID=2644732 RepID=UPI00086B7DEF|nr:MULTISPECIES: (2Fe-2S)-binding protein [unclassified Novosphingobium]MBN9143003.1 (2Fe-2S)-binding protein [Novosphingobium sp.]MDR6706088.1 isoquinoline 1-oxidoreductase alpha subunit [Novosphingobium sp. 1748]ODU84859.1 MAG: isoquinoline 1-oxidoreductase [Novosphingobium sp. SCN 63-17]OJX89361.1 MAG: isoquinoline 1-oxidoreductase [Novosphingobium sp. 63-713]